jgi:uncharacterized protein YjbI with pentapeptide repeats
MADPEHLEILEKGVDHWNKWRNENLETVPNLSAAKLSGAILRGADLRRVDFYMANLVGADLSHANLIEADLIETNLLKTNLTKAELLGANLCLVNLKEANLTGADLREANLSRADLANANIEEAILEGTIFAGVDLSQVNGLDTCKHNGPSHIDQLTLMRSGKLPVVFLRGCGFPDQFIQYLPSLLGSLDPIQFYSCFISYSHRDEEFAKRLYADLQAKGIRCWFAPQDLDIGDKIKDEIEKAIRIHDKLIIVLSENSLTRAWVVKEVNEGLEQEKIRNENVLFPVRLDDAIDKTTQQWAFDLKAERIVGDFSNWKDHDAYQETFKLLLRALGKKD